MLVFGDYSIFKIMPIYEYSCRGCGRLFEQLIRTGDTPACPACGSQDLERTISRCAISSEGSRAIALSSGRKAAKRYADEKAAADREYLEKHDH